MGNDPYGHKLLSVVTAVHHEGVRKALNDRALCFPKPLDGIAASRVGDVSWGADLDVISMRTGISSDTPRVSF